MKRKIKIFLAYSPVLLLAVQMVANIVWFIDPTFYYMVGFYLNALFGSSLFLGAILVGFTQLFPFCYVSRYAAFAQVLFTVNYMVVQQDNLYNIMFQIIVGALALLATFGYYANKFPLCQLGLLKRFIRNITKEKSCEKGISLYHQETKKLIRHRNDLTRNRL